MGRRGTGRDEMDDGERGFDTGQGLEDKNRSHSVPLYIRNGMKFGGTGRDETVQDGTGDFFFLNTYIFVLKLHVFS